MNSSVIDVENSWIFHREEIDTTQDGSCDIYLLLDGKDDYCFGQEISINLPDSKIILNLFKTAYGKRKLWPNYVLVSKKDPYLEELEPICKGLNLEIISLTPREFKPLIQNFHESFMQFKQGSNSVRKPPLTQADQKELEAFIPETYGPCPCGSGKKFKFCCKKGFKEITFAMCAAQDGHLEDALRFMKEAESKIGLTAEVLCRYAICWSFFDRKKSAKFLKDALKSNLNHPRANYISGIEAVESKKYEEAISFYQRAIENYSSEDKFHLNETYNNMGTACYEMKDYKNAKLSWEKALTFLPSDRMVLENLFEFIYNNSLVPEEIREVTPFMKKFIETEC